MARPRKHWRALTDEERRFRARLEPRQLSFFGPVHTYELRLPRVLKKALPGRRPQRSAIMEPTDER
jgi:hypothetical protein